MRPGQVEIVIGALVCSLEFLDTMWMKAPLLGACVLIFSLVLTAQGIAKLSASYVRDGFDKPSKPDESLPEMTAQRLAAKGTTGLKD